ncbi:scavenger receptor class A member 3-like protein [Lates japonicus]|uniref:Scavenger receptor class A member 3-like protein n=1 Tax=Lates japonicus TaxID=270547 RepID=A0AAD3RLY5_LATJO|nr:scavenger receptor class A member 3-like protein [Lates japonicus]
MQTTSCPSNLNQSWRYLDVWRAGRDVIEETEEKMRNSGGGSVWRQATAQQVNTTVALRYSREPLWVSVSLPLDDAPELHRDEIVQSSSINHGAPGPPGPKGQVVNPGLKGPMGLTGSKGDRGPWKAVDPLEEGSLGPKGSR